MLWCKLVFIYCGRICSRMLPMLFDTIYKKYEQFTALLASVAALLILAMSFWVTYDVLARQLFSISSPWSFDLSEYTLVWVTFLAAPWVLLQDRHVRIEILVDVLPAPVKRLLGIAVCVVAFSACLVLAWRTGIAGYQYFDREVMMARIWRIPRIYPYSILPIGSVLLAIAFLLRLGLYVRNEDAETLLRKKASAGQESGLSTTESE